MRGERKDLQLHVFVIVVGLLLALFNLAYGEKEVSIPVRPFAVDPENWHLKFDGLFNVKSGNQFIGVFLKNDSYETISNVTARASFEEGSKIVLTKNSCEFRYLEPGISVLGFFKANFDASSPGKYRLILEVSGDSFKQEISRNLFVICAEFDPKAPNKWTVQTPEGAITTIINEFFSDTKGGSSVVAKSFKWGIEHVPFEGQFSDLPYKDPWWKVIGSFVPVGGAPNAIDKEITELYGEGCGNAIRSIVRTAFAASTLAVTTDDFDPFRCGQLYAESPGPGEVTTKEEVSVEFLSNPMAGEDDTAWVEWTYTRTTDVRTYPKYKFEEKVDNTRFTKKQPEVKIESRKVGSGVDFIFTAQTDRPKKMSNNNAYFVANLFRTDDKQLKEVAQTIILRDDGRGGDEVAGDGTYTGMKSVAQLPLENSLNAFVFGFDINNASETVSSETAAKNIGGVFVSTPPKLFDLTPDCRIKKNGEIEKPEDEKKSEEDKKPEDEKKIEDEKKPEEDKKPPDTKEPTVKEPSAMEPPVKEPPVKELPVEEPPAKKPTVKKPPYTKKPPVRPPPVTPKILYPPSVRLEGWVSRSLINSNGTEIQGNSISAGEIIDPFSWCVKLSLANILHSRPYVIGVSGGYRLHLKGTKEIEAFSAYAIPLELFYRQHFGKKFFLRLAAGVDFYRSTLSLNMGTVFKDSDLGFHFSLGTGYFLNHKKKLALTFGVEYLSAKLKNFIDTERLFVVEDPATGDLKLVIDAENALLDPLEIDFSGLKLSVGMTLCLTR